MDYLLDPQYIVNTYIYYSTMLDLTKMTRTKKGKKDCLVCHHCGHTENIRMVPFDFKLAKAFEWVLDEYARTGNFVIGVTKKANPNVPDWVVADRNVSKLKYWGILTPAGQGKYRLLFNDEDLRKLRGGEGKVTSAMFVANDRTVGSTGKGIPWKKVAEGYYDPDCMRV